MLFHHPIPTPIEITKAATFNLPAEKRNLPNNGLTLEQMAHAVRNVGLEPFPVRINDNEYILKSTLYAYLRAGVPVALALILIDKSITPYSYYGAHAVAVTGYCIGSGQPQPLLLNNTNMLTRSSRIDRIYVHDDQVGPFARMVFDGEVVNYPVNGVTKDWFSLSTSWQNRNKSLGSVRALPLAVLVPVYHKIRIPFESIDDIVIDFDSVLETFRNAGFVKLSKRLEWDIFLSNLNDFKKEVLTTTHLNNGHREAVLIEKMPRFLWRATATIDDVPQIDLVFDATDIEQGKFFLRAVTYSDELSITLKSLISQPSIRAFIENTKSRTVFEWFVR